MDNRQNSDKLQQIVADMALLEGQIEAALDSRRSEVSDHPEAADAVDRFHAMAKSHKEAMESRLQSIGGAESSFKGTIAAMPLDTAGTVDGDGAPRHGSTVLQVTSRQVV